MNTTASRKRCATLALTFAILGSHEECSAMDKIALELAQRIAQRELDRTSPKHQFTLVPGDAQELPFGWVFGFAPKRYLETHNVNDKVPGPTLIVIEHNGSVQFLPSAPRTTAITEFTRQWQQRHH